MENTSQNLSSLNEKYDKEEVNPPSRSATAHEKYGLFSMVLPRKDAFRVLL